MTWRSTGNTNKSQHQQQQTESQISFHFFLNLMTKVKRISRNFAYLSALFETKTKQINVKQHR